MAATLLPTSQAKLSAVNNLVGVTPSTPDTSNGNVFLNTGKEMLLVQTGGASGATLTITPLKKLLGALPVPSPTYTLGANALAPIGPFDTDTYNGNTSGSVVAPGSMVAVAWSSVTGTVNCWVVSLPAASAPA